METATGGDDYQSSKDVQTDESLAVAGEAPDVLEAERQAWELLESVLGRDPVGAWSLSEMRHVIIKERGVIEWSARFTRDPEVGLPPLQYRYDPDAQPVEAGEA